MTVKSKFTLFIVAIGLLTGCGDNKQKQDALKQSNQIIDPKIGSKKLLQEAQKYYDNNEFEKSKEVLNILIMEYPASKEANDALDLSSEIKLANNPNINYKIISEEPNQKLSKCNLKIQLNEKIHKNTLTTIAKVLRKTRTNYDKLWIFYYIKNTSTNGMAWATSHFTPNLIVEILGSTIDQDVNSNIIIEQKKWDNSKAGKIQKKHPDWTKEDCQKLAKNEIWIGMSLDMLKYLRGNPNNANPSNYGNGTSWQWCWTNFTPSCFYGGSNGIITSYN